MTARKDGHTLLPPVAMEGCPFETGQGHEAERETPPDLNYERPSNRS